MPGYDVRGARRRTFDLRREYRSRRLGRAIRNGKLTVEMIGSRDHLYEMYEEMRSSGGQAPGLDGLHYDDLSPNEVGRIVGCISSDIIRGRYRPHPARKVSIPKTRGGTRTLLLRHIFDRVVAKAMHHCMSPAWEQVFLPSSYGFRPKRSALEMLAAMEAYMIRNDSWVIAQSDVTAAFDNVQIKHALKAHRQLFEELGWAEENTKPILRLVGAVLRGDNGRRTMGIDQGSSYSPTSLNGVLHYNLDLRFNDSSCAGRFRYADNNICVARSVPDGQKMLHQIDNLLRPISMTTHAENPVDLDSGKLVQTLGFNLCRNGNELKYSLGDKAWLELKESLVKVHEGMHPQRRARSVIQGWIESHGPANGKGELLDQVLSLAGKMGFTETSPEDLQQAMDRSYNAWIKTRVATRQK